jgi:hypothetical protein
MANQFQAESDLRHRARRAMIALCIEEGEEACQLVLDQAIGRVRRKEEADTHRTLDSVEPFAEHDMYPALNLAYAQQRHQDRQYRRD